MASIMSVFRKCTDHQYKKSGGTLLTSLTEEESINLFFMVFLIPSGWIMRFLIKFTLAMWALIHVCILAEQTLLDNPETIGLATLHPMIQWVNLSRVEIAIMKNKIEIFIGLICAPMVFMGHAAMIFPVMYFQYIRIKYVSSYLQKHSWSEFEHAIKSLMPEVVWNNFLYAALKNWLLSFVEFSDADRKKNE
jgi:hypothetical protein